MSTAKKDVMVGAFVAVAALLVSALLAVGGLNEMGSGQDDDIWTGSQFASLAGLGLLLLVGGAVRGWMKREDGPWTLSLVGIAAQLHFASCVTVFALAWDNGRENYWEPGPFGVLIWCWSLAALLAFAAHWTAGRRGNPASQMLLGVAGLQAIGSVLAWMYTWSGWLQGLQGDIGRALFLATHG